MEASFEQTNSALRQEIALLKEKGATDKQKFNEQIDQLEEELDNLSRELAEKENEAMSLTEKLESMHAEQLLPTVLIQHMKDLIETIKKEDDRRIAEQARSTGTQFVTYTLSHFLTASNSPRVQKNMVKLDGDVKIDSDALKNALAYRMTANTDHNLNQMINTILEALYKPSKMALMSLSGWPCPSIKGCVAKDKLPTHLLTAVKNFSRKKWKEWYDVIPTDKAINTAVSAKLTSSHTSLKKLNKKTAEIEKFIF